MKITLKRKKVVTVGGLNELYGLTPRTGHIGRVSKSKPPTLNITNSFHVCEQALTFGKIPHMQKIKFARPKPRNAG